MDVLAAFAAAGGSVQDAADLAGIRPSTVKRHLADLRARSGLTTEQLICAGQAAGWLLIPMLSLNTWLMKWDGRIAGQLARHAFRHTTRSTGGVEQHLRAIYARIEDRRHMFANRERLDRLLLLMTMEMRGSLNEREWAKVIRSWLLISGGQPPPSRQITDHMGGPRKTSSLRLGGAPT